MEDATRKKDNAWSVDHIPGLEAQWTVAMERVLLAMADKDLTIRQVCQVKPINYFSHVVHECYRVSN